MNLLLPDVLLSVCHVTPEGRDALLGWIDGRIQKLGGPVQKAYLARGKSLSAVAPLLTLTRMRLVLVKAMRVTKEDCPFWVEPSDWFPGRQISDDRWTLSLSGGGKGIAARQHDDLDWSAGGSGRVMIGRAVGSRWSMYGGAELGASAAFPKDDMGARSSLEVTFDLAVPVVVRYRLVNTYVEGAFGYFLRAEEQSLDSDHGLHFGVAFGGQGSRQRIVFPGAALVASYERTFWADNPLDLVKIGLRVVLDLDF